MKKAAILSAVLHFVLILLLIFGLPVSKLTPDLAPMTAIPVELLTIAAITQAPNPAPLPARQETVEPTPPKPSPKPEPVTQPEPPKTISTPEITPPVEPESKPDIDELRAIAEQLKAAEKPAEIKEIIPAPEAKPKSPEPPEKTVAKPVIKVKPVVEKSHDKPKKKDKKADTSFNSVLKNLAKLKTQPKESDQDNNTSSDKQSGHVGAVGPALTMSEQDAFRQQISSCWSINSGAKDIDQLVVTLTIMVNPDRTVRDAQITPGSKFAQHPFYRSIAESAVRAVRDPRCSPLRLPEGKYEQWKDITMNFTPPI